MCEVVGAGWCVHHAWGSGCMPPRPTFVKISCSEIDSGAISYDDMRMLVLKTICGRSS